MDLISRSTKSVSSIRGAKQEKQTNKQNTCQSVSVKRGGERGPKGSREVSKVGYRRHFMRCSIPGAKCSAEKLDTLG